MQNDFGKILKNEGEVFHFLILEQSGNVFVMKQGGG